MLDVHQIFKTVLNEFNGNKYFVNYNANPNKLRLSDCAIRALTKATDLPYNFILQCAKDANLKDYHVDDDGNSVPWGERGYRGQGYGAATLEILQDERLLPLVENVYDFSGTDIDLLEFTAYMSTKAQFKNKGIVTLLTSPRKDIVLQTDESDVSSFNNKLDSIIGKFKTQQKNFDNLEKKVIKGKFKLSNYKDIPDLEHAVCVKNGKYYDIWDSGNMLVQIAVVFKTNSSQKIKDITSKNMFQIGSDSDSNAMLDRVGKKILAKSIRHDRHDDNIDFSMAHSQLYSKKRKGIDGIAEIFKKNKISISNPNVLKRVWLVRENGSEPYIRYGIDEFGRWPGADSYYEDKNGIVNLNKYIKLYDNVEDFPMSHTTQILRRLYDESKVDKVFKFKIEQNDKAKYIWRIDFDNVLTYKLRKKYKINFYVFKFVRVTLDSI